MPAGFVMRITRLLCVVTSVVFLATGVIPLTGLGSPGNVTPLTLISVEGPAVWASTAAGDAETRLRRTATFIHRVTDISGCYLFDMDPRDCHALHSRPSGRDYRWGSPYTRAIRAFPLESPDFPSFKIRGSCQQIPRLPPRGPFVGRGISSPKALRQGALDSTSDPRTSLRTGLGRRPPPCDTEPAASFLGKTPRPGIAGECVSRVAPRRSARLRLGFASALGLRLLAGPHSNQSARPARAVSGGQCLRRSASVPTCQEPAASPWQEPAASPGRSPRCRCRHGELRYVRPRGRPRDLRSGLR